MIGLAGLYCCNVSLSGGSLISMRPVERIHRCHGPHCQQTVFGNCCLMICRTVSRRSWVCPCYMRLPMGCPCSVHILNSTNMKIIGWTWHSSKSAGGGAMSAASGNARAQAPDPRLCDSNAYPMQVQHDRCGDQKAEHLETGSSQIDSSTFITWSLHQANNSAGVKF